MSTKECKERQNIERVQTTLHAFVCIGGSLSNSTTTATPRTTSMMKKIIFIICNNLGHV